MAVLAERGLSDGMLNRGDGPGCVLIHILDGYRHIVLVHHVLHIVEGKACKLEEDSVLIDMDFFWSSFCLADRAI